MLASLLPAFGFHFPDFYDREGLVRLDACFLDFLAERDAALHGRLLAARAAPDGIAGKPESELILALAPELEDFLGELFGIAGELAEMRRRHDVLAPLYSVKRLFVQRRAAKKYPPDVAATFNTDGALRREVEALIGGEVTELAFATQVERWMQSETEHAAALDTAARYAAWATHTVEGQHAHKGGMLFRVPHKIDPLHLVPVETEIVDGVTMLKLPAAHRRARDGFALTDPGTDLAGALDQANYCIWCHNQGKDSCSKGLKEKTGEFKKSPFGVMLAGCPLDEKISEMNLAQAEGHTARRARHRDRRQPDVRRHRPPHLQRLHEGLHLPEAGAGRHSAGRDPHPQGRAGAALGLRDLFAADALESAQHPPPAAEAGERPQGTGRRARPGRLHAGAPSDERRPHGRGDRRAEDRAAGRGDFRRRAVRRARAVPADSRHRRAARGSRRRA